MNPRPGDGEAQASPSASRPKRKRRVLPAEMPAAERLEAAVQAAVRALGSRERSEAEVRLLLARKGFDRETVLIALDRLRTAGLQDDSRFAEVYAAELSGRRGMSASAVRGHLRGKGVSAELASQAAATSPEAEEERARVVATKRARALSGLPLETGRRRLIGFLARRGYPMELCARLAGELIGASDAAEEG